VCVCVCVCVWFVVWQGDRSMWYLRHLAPGALDPLTVPYSKIDVAKAFGVWGSKDPGQRPVWHGEPNVVRRLKPRFVLKMAICFSCSVMSAHIFNIEICLCLLFSGDVECNSMLKPKNII
jgi:hypothetical protein